MLHLGSGPRSWLFGPAASSSPSGRKFERLRRGIYRLTRFPSVGREQEDLMVVWLWSNSAVVYSHATARQVGALRRCARRKHALRPEVVPRVGASTETDPEARGALTRVQAGRARCVRGLRSRADGVCHVGVCLATGRSCRLLSSASGSTAQAREQVIAEDVIVGVGASDLVVGHAAPVARSA